MANPPNCQSLWADRMLIISLFDLGLEDEAAVDTCYAEFASLESGKIIAIFHLNR